MKTDALDRLSENHLRRVEDDIERIRSRLKGRGGRGTRVVMHCHTHLSHDSEGRIAEIAKAARRTSTGVVMVTDHRREDLDVIADGYSGRRSGVTFVPGAEAKRLLIFMVKGLDFNRDQRQLIEDIRKRGGLAFLSHLENQDQWILPGLTGAEIYNFHASFLGQRRLRGLLEPKGGDDLERLLGVLQLLEDHPHSGFAAFCENPNEYLDRWDYLSSDGVITGIAANDSHANSGMSVNVRAGGEVDVLDFRGKPIARLPRWSEMSPGSSLEFRPDSYEVSFGHVGTHLVMKGTETEDLIECLVSSRCFVGFDWIADTSGFSYSFETGRASGGMGERVSLGSRPTLLADLPHTAHCVLRRDGSVEASVDTDRLEFVPSAPGKYRLEAYLTLAGERRPWILSNPIRVDP